MNLQKLLWSSLTGCVILIVSLLTSWGHSVESRFTGQAQTEQVLLQHDAQHDQELKDIHEDLLRIEKLLRDKR